MNLAGNTFFFDWEVSLMVWIQSRLGPFGETLANFFSMLGEEMAMVLILGFVYWCYDKEFGKFIGANMAVALSWNPMLKNLCLRRRPYFDNPQIQCLRPVEPKADIYDISAQSYSFPSGHSNNAAVAYGSLAVYKPKKKLLTVIAVLLILLVGVSRFCVGVHYPTDVLAGWIVGLAAVFLVPFVRKKIKKDLYFYLIWLFIALPGFFYCKTNDFFTDYGIMLGIFAAFMFEEKYVKFKNTRSAVRSILRVLFGAAVFFGLNTALKLPFSSEFLSGGTMASLLVRMFRYAIVCFITIGVYPMTFAVTAKIGKKEKEE